MSEPDKLTAEQHALVVKGFNAKYLLSQEAFATAINDLSSELANKMLSTRPDEKQTREDLFFMHKALEALIDTLKSYVEQMEIIEHEVAKAEALERDENQHDQE